MAYKVFIAGQEALAADVNTHLMSQTVSRFANAPTRAAELTAPAFNQLSVLDDRPGFVQYWNGGGWVDLSLPTPAIPAGYHLQAQNVVTTTDAFGSAVFTFPVAFSGLPVVVGTEASGINANLSIFYYTSTQVGFHVRGTDDLPVANGGVRVMYTATGPR
jgi:hypothetical protein